MGNKYSKTFNITTSELACNMMMSVYDFLKCLQTVATEHIEEMGAGFGVLQKKDDASWVISKMSVKFNCGLPTMGDVIKVETTPLEPKLIRFERQFKVLNLTTGEEVCEVNSLWCILDKKTRNVKRVSDISCYPKNFEYEKPELKPEYEMVDTTKLLNECKYVYTKRVGYSDLDVNGHMNNCIYSKAILDAFTSDELSGVKFKSLEVHFLSECMEGELIDVCRAFYDDKHFVIGIKNNKPCFIGVLKF